MDGVGGVSGADAGAGAADAGAGTQAAGTGAGAGTGTGTGAQPAGNAGTDAASNAATAGNATAGTDATGNATSGATQDKPAAMADAIEAAKKNAEAANGVKSLAANQSLDELKQNLAAYLDGKPTQQQQLNGNSLQQFSGPAIQDIGQTRCKAMCHTGSDPGPAGRDASQELLTRVGGVLKTVGGGAETMFGAGLSCIGLGIPIAANGFDNMQAGVREAIGGEPVKTETEKLLTGVAGRLGADPQTAEKIGSRVNTAIDLTVGGGMLYKSLTKGGALIGGAGSTENAAAKSEAVAGSNPVATAPIKTLEEAAPKPPSSNPVTSPIKNPSGDLDASANLARNQPYGNSASPPPGTNTAGNTGRAVKVPESTAPDGFAVRSDLAKHLAGPDGFKGGKLNGTHNQQNAIAELNTKNATYQLQPSGTNGISELSYSYTNPASGKVTTGSKTVYDPAVFSDQKMTDLSMNAAEKAYRQYTANPALTKFDTTYGGVNFRAYINFDSNGVPYVGNVHPIK